MEHITQQKIAKKLNRSQSFVSKRLTTNSLRGHEIIKLSKDFKVPLAAFCDPEEQVKHLGKLYIQDNDTVDQP